MYFCENFPSIINNYHKIYSENIYLILLFYIINKFKINIRKLAGEEWKMIKEDPKKKKKYDDMAIKDKKRYEKEINEYKK